MESEGADQLAHWFSLISAFVQLLTGSLDTIKCMNGPDDTLRMHRMISEYAYFVHVQKHIFA